MFNIYIIFKEDRSHFIKNGIFDELNTITNNAIYLFYSNGKLYVEKKIVLHNISQDDNTFLEVDFSNRGYYTVLEVYRNKKNRKILIKTFEITSIMCLNAQLDNYIAGVARMFNLPYFGNDLYLSTLLNDMVSQYIILKKNNLNVPPYTWFYYHDLGSKQNDIIAFLNKNKLKKVLLSDAVTYNNLERNQIEVFTIDDIETFVEESTKNNKTTKYILQVFPKIYKKVYCINGVVFGHINNEHKEIIKAKFFDIFKFLGQETQLYGVEFLIDNNIVYISKLLSLVDLFINKDKLKEDSEELEEIDLTNILKELLSKLKAERTAVFYANNRRLFSFQSKILDNEEGGKL